MTPAMPTDTRECIVFPSWDIAIRGIRVFVSCSQLDQLTVRDVLKCCHRITQVPPQSFAHTQRTLCSALTMIFLNQIPLLAGGHTRPLRGLFVINPTLCSTPRAHEDIFISNSSSQQTAMHGHGRVRQCGQLNLGSIRDNPLFAYKLWCKPCAPSYCTPSLLHRYEVSVNSPPSHHAVTHHCSAGLEMSPWHYSPLDSIDYAGAVRPGVHHKITGEKKATKVIELQVHVTSLLAIN
ncbi:hypothetical protein BDN67DRAFT_971975, partial [Paxillus ammoniavirescens]